MQQVGLTTKTKATLPLVSVVNLSLECFLCICSKNIGKSPLESYNLYLDLCVHLIQWATQLLSTK